MGPKRWRMGEGDKFSAQFPSPAKGSVTAQQRNKIGLAIQLSQGQDRQPLSPEGAHPPAVRA